MINAIGTDPAASAARSPTELAMYLRSQRWEMDGRNGVCMRWVKLLDGEEFETTQPLETGIRDYAARVRDLVQVLAVVEGRSELDVLRSISNVSTDVL